METEKEMTNTGEDKSGYEADVEMKPRKKYKLRLFVGEGNFSYSKSVIKKHEIDKPGLGQFITATELEEEYRLKGEEGFEENINYLRGKGVTVKFGVDINKYYREPSHSVTNNRYKRIQFNCPFVTNATTTRDLVTKFFQSAKELQQEGDRVQMKLVDSNEDWYLDRTYDIIEASAKAGYSLIKKRKFDKERYPEYKHQVTIGNADRNKEFSGHEYVFEKTTKTYEEIIKSNCSDISIIYIHPINGDRGFNKALDDWKNSHEPNSILFIFSPELREWRCYLITNVEKQCEEMTINKDSPFFKELEGLNRVKKAESHDKKNLGILLQKYKPFKSDVVTHRITKKLVDSYRDVNGKGESFKRTVFLPSLETDNDSSSYSDRSQGEQENKPEVNNLKRKFDESEDTQAESGKIFGFK